MCMSVFNLGSRYYTGTIFMRLFDDSDLVSGTKVTCNVACPGIVNTEHHRHMPFMKSAIIRISFYPIFWFLTKRAVDGAQTLIQCAVGTEEENVSGQYYS